MEDINKYDAKEQKLPKSRSGRIVGYIINIAVSAIMLYIASNLVRWQAQFITSDWPEVYGVVRFSLRLSIVAYASFILYERRSYYYLMRTALDAVSLYVAYRLVIVFPFNFEGFFHWGWLNGVFPILLWMGVIGMAISILVRTGKLMANKNIHY